MDLFVALDKEGIGTGLFGEHWFLCSVMNQEIFTGMDENMDRIANIAIPSYKNIRHIVLE